MRILLILLALLLNIPTQAGPSIAAVWRDAQTIRVDWRGDGCIFVEDVATDVCGSGGSRLVPFAVYAGQRVELRSADQVLASAIIPANPYPLPVTATWVDRTLHITIANPAPTRCLMLIGGGKLNVYLPESCGVSTYDLPITGVDSDYAPAGRTLRLVDTGNILYDLPIPPRSVIYLPWVARD